MHAAIVPSDPPRLKWKVRERRRRGDGRQILAMNRILIRAAVAVALLAALVVLRMNHHYPALPTPLVVDLVLAPGEAGRADPLIVSGRTNVGDFLGVRFEDE